MYDLAYIIGCGQFCISVITELLPYTKMGKPKFRNGFLSIVHQLDLEADIIIS